MAVIAVNTRFLLPNKLEGIGWYTYEVMNRVVELMPEHEFIFLFDRKYDSKFVFGPNVRPVVVHPQARHPILFRMWFEYAIPRILKKYKADLFFSPDGFLSMKTKVPTLLVVHDIAHFHFRNQISKTIQSYYDKWMPRFVNRANHIITVSNYSKYDLVKSYGIPDEKVEVILNGRRPKLKAVGQEQLEHFRNKHIGSNPYFLFVGAIHPRKNVKRLLEAFANFKANNNTNHKLVLVGRWAWKSQNVRDAFKSLGNDALHIPYLDGDELASAYSGATALIYVSLYEGFGLPIIESMQCDTPVITSNVSSMPEVAGEAAILVDPNNTDAITKAMNLISSNESLHSQLTARGRIQYQKFSWDKSAEQVVNRMKKMLY